MRRAGPLLSHNSIDCLREANLPFCEIDSAPVIDMSALEMWFAVLIGWLDRQELDALA
jgi:hypothetical protein